MRLRGEFTFSFFLPATVRVFDASICIGDLANFIAYPSSADLRAVARKFRKSLSRRGKEPFSQAARRNRKILHNKRV